MIIDILTAFDNPEYENDEKWVIALTIFYVDFEEMTTDLYEEACIKLREFIDMGQETDEDKNTVRLMDWEQDANLVIPAVNRVIGKEVRALEYMHWWTFLGAYMEIGECGFSQVVSIRNKRAKGKKLEKWEQEYLQANKSVVLLQPKLTDEEREAEKRLKDLF